MFNLTNEEKIKLLSDALKNIKTTVKNEKYGTRESILKTIDHVLEMIER
jgi:hypothetical protein